MDELIGQLEQGLLNSIKNFYFNWYKGGLILSGNTIKSLSNSFVLGKCQQIKKLAFYKVSI